MGFVKVALKTLCSKGPIKWYLSEFLGKIWIIDDILIDFERKP